MKITRYTTQSGSVYDVKDRESPLEVLAVRRHRLGQHHYDKGPEQVARRLGDLAGNGVWKRAKGFTCFGVGHVLAVKFGDGDRETLITSPVVRIDELEEVE